MTNAPLTKHQLCWVIIRVLGLFILVSGISDLILLISGISLTRGHFPHKFTIPFFAIFVIKIVVGIKLLSSGEWLHRLLMKEGIGNRSKSAPNEMPPPQSGRTVEKPPVDPVTKLTKTETQRFDQWLQNNPQYHQRDFPDQIALFRDHLATTKLFS